MESENWMKASIAWRLTSDESVTKNYMNECPNKYLYWKYLNIFNTNISHSAVYKTVSRTYTSRTIFSFSIVQTILWIWVENWDFEGKTKCNSAVKVLNLKTFAWAAAPPNLGHFLGIPTQRPQSAFQLFFYSRRFHFSKQKCESTFLSKCVSYK